MLEITKNCIVCQQVIEELKKQRFSDLDIKLFELNGKLQNLRLSKEDIQTYYVKDDKNIVKVKDDVQIEFGEMNEQQIDNWAFPKRIRIANV